MESQNRLLPPLVATPGDPLGVGPEVVVGAALALDLPLVICGDLRSIRAEARRQGLGLEERTADLGFRPGERGLILVEPPTGPAPVEVRAVEWAVEACLDGRARALVTGPINKARLAAAGFPFPGHTGFLGHLTGIEEPVMAFTGGRMRVALVTVHLPLAEVPGAITEARILRVVEISAQALERDLGVADPCLVVAGLNPHAGDGGLLGVEEVQIIGPACERARALGYRVVGPVSAEAAARMVASGEGDLMVAMYHDQGLAPLKVLDFGRSVNWTLGLPIVRTSVDHGTAEDIAGRGVADPASMIAALELADRVSARRWRIRATPGARTPG